MVFRIIRIPVGSVMRNIILFWQVSLEDKIRVMQNPTNSLNYYQLFVLPQKGKCHVNAEGNYTETICPPALLIGCCSYKKQREIQLP